MKGEKRRKEERKTKEKRDRERETTNKWGRYCQLLSYTKRERRGRETQESFSIIFY